MSENRLVKKLLARAVGLEPKADDDCRESLGLLSLAQRESFERRQADNKRIDDRG